MDTAGKTDAAVEERLQAVYTRCPSLNRQVGAHPGPLRGWVRSELRAVEAECTQFLGDRFGDLVKDLVQFMTEKNEPLNISLGELCFLAVGSLNVAVTVLAQP